LNERDNELERYEEFMRTYPRSLETLYWANSLYESGRYYYELASYYYDYDMFEDVIYFCSEARPYYSQSSQEYKNAEASFEKAKKSASQDFEEIITNYIGLADADDKASVNMYEACEYFELASLKQGVR